MNGIGRGRGFGGPVKTMDNNFGGFGAGGFSEQTSSSSSGFGDFREKNNSGYGGAGFSDKDSAGFGDLRDKNSGFRSVQDRNSSNSGFGGGGFQERNPNSGYGGFPEEVMKPKITTTSTASKDYDFIGGGFKDWNEIAHDMRRYEQAKWGDMPAIVKCFYKEHPEITAMTEGEADAVRLTKNNIMVEDTAKSRVPPKLVTKFEHAFSDQPEILEQIEKQKFTDPSPIQCQMWPIALSGHDVIGIAQTGTGKTLGFLLPIFVHLDNQPITRAQRGGPGCLILSPTRELAIQIHQEIKKFKFKGMRSICIYGGGNRREQIEGYLEGMDIIIATPGRLNDLVCADVINLRSISFLVLDEADRMLDMGFEPQIYKILLDVRPDRQTIMTSATWPKSVRELGERYTKEAFHIVVGSLDLTACHSVTQIVEIVHEEEKRDHLLDFLTLMKPTEKVIVFVGKKSLVDDLSSDLSRAGIRCSSIHGDRDQGDRERALDDIKKGKVNILIATDVASRGLDIVDITHVYNFDFPRHMEEYVHRVGRTGRAGRSGVSVTLVTKYEWTKAAELIKVLEEAGQDVPDALRRMAERFALKKLENPDFGRDRRYGGGGREKKEWCMADYL